MAFLLRALGWRASFSSSLTSLYLDLSGDKWWGPQHFQAVWARNAASNRVPPGTLAAHARLTDAAFTHLTSLHLHVSVSRGDLAAATAAVARFLSAAGNLTRLDLALPTVYPGSVTALADLDILALISRAVRWPRIRHVAFASTLTGPSLVAALTRVAASIRSLRLLDCTLLGAGDSWSRVYRALRHVPFAELRALDFRDCIDGDADEEGEALPDPLEEGYRRLHFTSLMQVRPAVGHFSLVQGLLVRKGYSADLYEWILGRREVMPALYRYSM
ncbi:uncharacterized protein LTHEOB_3709 [Neofusicoccum parvum]|nr:uncharacterized protein LTHEOB_3709 [Neofusicoccum parvum]